MDRASCELLLTKVDERRDEENRKTAGGAKPRFIPATLKLSLVLFARPKSR